MTRHVTIDVQNGYAAPSDLSPGVQVRINDGTDYERTYLGGEGLQPINQPGQDVLGSWKPDLIVHVADGSVTVTRIAGDVTLTVREHTGYQADGTTPEFATAAVFAGSIAPLAA